MSNNNVQGEIKTLEDTLRGLRGALNEREGDLHANSKLLETLQTSNRELMKNLGDVTRQEQV